MAEPELPICGGCLCGAIRYEISRVPAATAVCHCRDCQRTTGSAFAPVFSVGERSFRLVSGEPRIYELAADSGRRVRRFFCGDCGSPLFGRPDAMPRAVNVLAGTLDEPDWFRPQMALFCGSAWPWVSIPDAPRVLPGMPDQVPE
jgi:hypothetical protein